MTNKILIEKIAHKIGWDTKQAKTAIKNLSESGTTLNYKEILTLSLEHKTPEVRIAHIIDYLSKNNKQNFVTFLASLFRIDPCIYSVALFNIIDLIKQRKYVFSFVELNANGSELKDLPNDFNFILAPKLLPNKELDKLIRPIDLSYDIIQSLIVSEINLSTQDTYFDSLTAIFLPLSEKVGFPIFNIPIFLELGNHLWYSPDREKDFRHIYDSIYTNYISGIQANKRKYWLIFTLVELLKYKGCQQKEAIREISNYLGYTVGSTRRRYFDKKKELIETPISFKEIIDHHQLNTAIGKYLEYKSKS